MNRNFSTLTASAKTPALPAALLLFGTILVFVPTEIFRGNQTFFSVGLLEHLLVLVPLWLVLSVLFALPTLGTLKPWKARYAAAMTGLVVAVWVNANFQTGTEGLLDGHSFTLVQDPVILGLNLALFVGIMVAMYAVAMRQPRLARNFTWALLALLAAHTLIVAASGQKTKAATGRQDQLASFSRESNVLLFLLDTLQGDLFEDILELDPALAAQLPGFTSFSEAASVSPTTYLAIPSIHSGQRFEPGQQLLSFYDNTVVRDSFLTKLTDNGFESILVYPMLGVCPDKVACEDPKRLTLGVRSSLFRSAAELTDQGLLRAVPHVLKPYVYQSGAWIFSGMSPFRLVHQEVSNLVLELMNTAVNADAPRPTAKLIHLMNTHQPAVFTETCEYKKGMRWTRTTAAAQARCVFGHLTPLLEKMKRLGVYDQSTILIFADHGSYLSRSGETVVGSRASPLLLVKPPGASGPLRISRAQASLADIPATVCALSKACKTTSGTNVMALGEGVVRDRYFVDYIWRRDAISLDPFPIEGHFVLRGPPRNVDSWERIPPAGAKPVHQLAFTKADPTDLFGPGWQAPRAKAPRWTHASQAVAWVNPVPGGTGRVTALVSTHEQNSAQQMTVTVAGQVVFRGPVKPGDSQEIAFQMPQSAMRQRQLALRFAFSQWTRNGTKGANSAVAFHKLEIQ